MTPRYDSMDTSANTTSTDSTTPFAPLENNNGTTNTTDLVATAAADLIRKLDTCYAETTADIVTGAREAQDARRNARIAAELARKFGSKTAWQEDQPEVLASPLPAVPVRPPSPVPTRDTELSVDLDAAMDAAAATATTSPSFSGSSYPAWKMNGTSNGQSSPHGTALAQAHADEFLQVTIDLERTQEALEREQCAHQETQATVQQLQSRLERVENQLSAAQDDVETAREQYGRQMDELQQHLQAETTRADVAEEDANVALELAKNKAEAEHEMRHYLHEVLERNEEYRECLATNMASTPDEMEEHQKNRQALVAAGRQLIQSRSTPSPRKAPPPAAPSPVMTTQTATLKATALLRESGRRLGMTVKGHESLDKLARRYANFTETEMDHLRQNVKQLESLIALLETGTIGGPTSV